MAVSALRALEAAAAAAAASADVAELHRSSTVASASRSRWAAMTSLAAPEEDELLADTDLLYEEDILRNAYSLKYWWRYLDAKKRAPPKQRNMIAERALKYLPGSYKVWKMYLKDRRDQVKHRRPDDPAIENLNHTYERALVTMHKMPRIWLNYLEFLTGQHKLTFTRHAFDRALRALPVTQHERIWDCLLYTSPSPRDS